MAESAYKCGRYFVVNESLNTVGDSSRYVLMVLRYLFCNDTMKRAYYINERATEQCSNDPLSSGLALAGNQGNKIVPQHLVPTSPQSRNQRCLSGSTVTQTSKTLNLGAVDHLHPSPVRSAMIRAVSNGLEICGEELVPESILEIDRKLGASRGKVVVLSGKQ